MDFSLNVDPSLQSLASSSSPSSSSSHYSDSVSLDYMASYDFDLLSEGLHLYPSMVYQTIEPTQLTDSYSSQCSPAPSSALVTPSSSPSPPPRSPSYTSDTSSESATRPRRRINKQKAEKQKVATDDDHSHSPYDKEHSHHVKRHQTKLACSWCRKLSKKCDAERPCGRCVQFNRCSECVNAPPRRARAKVDERGPYKRTRDLAAVDYQGAVHKRQAYVAKRERLGRTVKLGLTPDDLLEKAREENAKMMKKAENLGLTSSIPSEDLFTWSESPDNDDLLLSLRSSSEDSLFDTSSTNSTSVTEVDDTFHVTGSQYQTLNMFPNIMGLIAAARALDSAPNASGLHSLHSRSEIALAT